MSLLTRFSSVARLVRAPTVASQRLATIAVSHASATSQSEPVAAAVAKDRPHHIVMSISGRDRPGIVKSVTESLLERKANMEESRMAILGGDFAMIVYVSMENTEDSSKLANELRADLPNFSISVRETTPPAHVEAVKPMWMFTLEGPDHPGIVASVSEALATNGCNVHEMDTETTSAPFAGYELFKVTAKVTVDDKKLDGLSKALNMVEDKYGSTISLVQDQPN